MTIDNLSGMSLWDQKTCGLFLSVTMKRLKLPKTKTRGKLLYLIQKSKRLIAPDIEGQNAFTVESISNPSVSQTASKS